MANRYSSPGAAPRKTKIILDTSHLIFAILNSMKQKKSKDEYITKKYLDERFDAFSQAFRKEMVFFGETLYEKIERKIQQVNDRLYNMLDKIIKELEEIREDKVIGAHQTKELRERVDDHDKRIKKLERN